MSIVRNAYTQLRQDNDDGLAGLTGENLGMLQRMSQYLKANNIALFELEILKKDLIGMAQEAETLGISMEEKMGVPEKDFCDSLLEGTMKKRWYEPYFFYLKNILLAISIWNTIMFFIVGCPEKFGITVGALFYAGIWCFIFEVLREKIQNRFLYKNKKIKNMLVLLNIVLVMIWVAIPADWIWGIQVNGWALTIGLFAIAFTGILLNNSYWNHQAKKYRWDSESA